MTFDELFARLVRLTGWGMGIYAILTHQLDSAEIVALILAFIGFEFVARKRDKVLKEMGE